MLQLNHKSEVTNAQGFDEIVKRIFRGNTIEQNGEFINLTDMWRASGLDENWKPAQYMRLISVGTIGGFKGADLHFYTRKGRFHGGTWAHTSVAIRYAEWLSPDIYAWATRALMTQIAEERNPELKIASGIDKTREKYSKLGMSPEWIDKRVNSVVSFKMLNSELANHGCVTGEDYGRVHGAINRGCLGVSSKQIKAERGVTNTRDGLDEIELGLISMTQTATRKNIAKKDINGSYQIAAEANTIGNKLRQALSEILA